MSPTESRERGIYKTTLIGSLVNIGLVLGKFGAGVAGRSSALIADAVHSLSDLVTDIVVIAFVRVSGKPRDEDHDYGHGKFEAFATLIIGALLVAVAIGIGYGGVRKIGAVIRGAVLPAPGWIALVVALISIVSKEILYRYTVARGRRLSSEALIANGWHHRSDALSSVGTAVGIGGAIVLGARWTVLDPIAAVLVSLLILYTAWKLARPAIDELTERSLSDEVEHEIAGIVLSFPDVSDLHDLRTRKIGIHYAIEFHLRMAPGTPLVVAHDRATEIEQALRKHYGAGTHTIVHMEPEK